MSPDVHALTGAYVLDAVNDLERADFERHLGECDACAQEVRELRETAARLGHAAAAPPPPWLKSRVLSQITQVRQLPVEVWPGAGRPPSRWALRLTSAAAAVLLVVSVALGVLFIREREAADEGRAAAAAMLGSDDAQFFFSQAQNGGTALVVVSRSQGRAVVVATGMPELPDDKTYQAWFLRGTDAPRSAGLVQAGSALAVGDLGNAESIGLTIEPLGGSEQPTPPVLVQVGIPA